MIFLTQLPIEECRARLAAGIDIEKTGLGSGLLFGAKPIRGEIRDDGFRIRKRSFINNPLSQYFLGRFVATGRDVRIEGEFGTGRLGKLLLIVASFLGFLLMVLYFTTVGRPIAQRYPAILVIFPGMIAYYFGSFAFWQWHARREEQSVLAFLKSTFEVSAGADGTPIQ